MQEAKSGPAENWVKIAEKLEFKPLQNSVSSFLEGWHTYAHESQPSWKLLGKVLGKIKGKQAMVQIQWNNGMYRDPFIEMIMLT